MSEKLFAKVEENFYECLRSELPEEVTAALKQFKKSLAEIEPYSTQAKQYTTLFVEIFQFKATSSRQLWDETPGLYAAIGEFIHLRNPYEDEFRHEIEKMGLGRCLEMIS